MLDQEPLWYPSRGPLNPGIPNRQLWAIGMIVTQWGMAEFIRNQNIVSLIGDDEKATTQYNGIRNSVQKTELWKTLVEAKLQDAERAQNLDFTARFQRLNDRRDHIVHRMWGGGIETDTLGAPIDAPTTDAGLHRTRDEKKKTKSMDGRANFSWRIDFADLRKIANDIAQLNQDILVSWLPPDQRTGTFHIWCYLNVHGKLEVGIASASESKPHLIG